jgi:fatty-acyl-CoA synthase
VCGVFYEKAYLELAQKEDAIWQKIERNLTTNWTEIWREKAKTYGDNLIITEVDGKSYTYQELELASENIANYIRAHIKEERIGLYHDNSFVFLAALIGINKTGRLAVLFNTREPISRIEALAKSAKVAVVFGKQIGDLAYHDIQTCIDTPTQAPMMLADLETTLDDAAFVIFTSGTSGPSKPALFSHRRMIGAGVAWSLRTFMDEKSLCYITLPLYHGNALAVAFSAVVSAGASALLRKKFSVTHFFEDINHHGCTHMVYIGELWRYLLNRYHDNPNKTLHTIFGNGLTKSLWREVTKRYGIKHVVEHFGATEMPAAALTNWFDVAGYCGYIPPLTPEYKDVIMIDEMGEEVGIDEVGEAIFRVPKNRYRGYLDPALDTPKVLEREGNLWWRSGDLLKRNSEGFFTFVDRAGDSYRFKGENVSSVDVERVLMESGYCEEAVVYGIKLPHIDGKIGMASLVLKKPLDTGFYTYLKAHLAPYALPYFLRISKALHKTTATLKIQKAHLAKEGIEGYHDKQHYLLFADKYQVLDERIYYDLQDAKIALGRSLS